MRCPLEKEYGDIVCRGGLLWGLTYSDSAPPDSRQCLGECDWRGHKENPEPAQAGLTAGGGSGSANVSAGVTLGDSAKGNAAGEAGGHFAEPKAVDPAAPDPRDPRPESEMVGRDPIFRDHNCWRCSDGLLPCKHDYSRQCEYLHARND